jgi:hypothetical protein
MIDAVSGSTALAVGAAVEMMIEVERLTTCRVRSVGGEEA